MARDVSNEHLFNLVHARPGIWDTSCRDHIGRITKKRLWEEIFVEVTPNWASLRERQREKHGKCLWNVYLGGVAC